MQHGAIVVIGRSFLIARDDLSALNHAADVLRAWEPFWDLDIPSPHARLYDPDGTLFGVCWGKPMTVLHNHREQVLSAGDLLIVPRDLALDIEPEVDLLALRYSGAPPDHFRERFIQVWGFEHAACPSAMLAPGGSVEVIQVSDPRYPLSYIVVQCAEPTRTRYATSLESVVLVTINGIPSVVVMGDSEETHRLNPGEALLLGPGLEFAVNGQGRLGIATLFTELGQNARRSQAIRAGGMAGPEFDPSIRRPR